MNSCWTLPVSQVVWVISGILPVIIPALKLVRTPLTWICIERIVFVPITIPIGSMYGIYANIGGILMVNVTIYSSTMVPMGLLVRSFRNLICTRLPQLCSYTRYVQCTHSSKALPPFTTGSGYLNHLRHWLGFPLLTLDNIGTYQGFLSPQCFSHIAMDSTAPFKKWLRKHRDTVTLPSRLRLRPTSSSER